MRQLFPGFAFEPRGALWRGTLQPTSISPVYTVAVAYRPPRSPVVRVTRPTIDPAAPHRYRDGSLCLHAPADLDWHPGRFVAETIIPWTAEWLLYYEAWLADPDRRWFGPEAPHGRFARKKG